MDLPTRSIWKIRLSADLAGRRITLVGVVATLKFSDSGIRKEDVASGGGRAGSGVPENCNLREAPEGEGEADCRLHLGGHAGGEDDAGVGCH